MFIVFFFTSTRNDLLNIKDNLASIAVYQKNMDNNVNQKFTTLRTRSYPNLLTRLNQLPPKNNHVPMPINVMNQPTNEIHKSGDTMVDADDEREDDDTESDNVSSYRNMRSYGNGEEYEAAPVPSYGYAPNYYGYSGVNKISTKKTYVIFFYGLF